MSSYQVQLNNFDGLFDQSNITVAYQNLQESRHDRRLNNSNLNNRIEDVNIFSLNADFKKVISKNVLGYGFELIKNDIRSSAYSLNIGNGSNSALDTRYPDGGSKVFSAAAFVSHHFNISEKWIVSEGLRLNYVGLNSKFKNKAFFPFPYNSIAQKNIALNGNLSLVFKPTGNCLHWAPPVSVHPT